MGFTKYKISSFFYLLEAHSCFGKKIIPALFNQLFSVRKISFLPLCDCFKKKDFSLLSQPFLSEKVVQCFNIRCHWDKPKAKHKKCLSSIFFLFPFFAPISFWKKVLIVSHDFQTFHSPVGHRRLKKFGIFFLNLNEDFNVKGSSGGSPSVAHVMKVF